MRHLFFQDITEEMVSDSESGFFPTER